MFVLHIIFFLSLGFHTSARWPGRKVYDLEGRIAIEVMTLVRIPWSIYLFILIVFIYTFPCWNHIAWVVIFFKNRLFLSINIKVGLVVLELLIQNQHFDCFDL